MCCGDAAVLDLPPAVIEMLARYRGLQAEQGWDWGDDRIEMFRWARFAALGDVFAAYAETGDWPRAVRAVVGSDPPAGVAVVRVRADAVTVNCGPHLRWASKRHRSRSHYRLALSAVDDENGAPYHGSASPPCGLMSL